jgi:hypothetical protein
MFFLLFIEDLEREVAEGTDKNQRLIEEQGRMGSQQTRAIP